MSAWRLETILVLHKPAPKTLKGCAWFLHELFSCRQDHEEGQFPTPSSGCHPARAGHFCCSALKTWLSRLTAWRFPWTCSCHLHCRLRQMALKQHGIVQMISWWAAWRTAFPQAQLGLQDVSGECCWHALALLAIWAQEFASLNTRPWAATNTALQLSLEKDFFSAQEGSSVLETPAWKHSIESPWQSSSAVCMSFRAFYHSALLWWNSSSALGTRYFYLRYLAWECGLMDYQDPDATKGAGPQPCREETAVAWLCYGYRRYLWVSGTCTPLPFC